MGFKESRTLGFFLKPQNILLILTVGSVVVGILLGVLLRYAKPNSDAIRYIGFPGELFMNMLKCMILPLIASSLITSLASLDGKTSGKVGSRAILYYVLTTTHAVILGIILVMLIHPGNPKLKNDYDGPIEEVAKEDATSTDKFLDLIRNMFPENLIQTMFEQQKTVYKESYDDNGTVIKKTPTVEYTPGMNVLGLIIFCIVFGIVISRVGAAGRPLRDLFKAIDLVITKMVTIIMWIGPIGIASLIASKILGISDLAGTVKMLGMYMLTVIIGLLIQAFITLPAIFFFATRSNPFSFLKGLSQAVLTALGTSSSAATLPITFRCLNEIGIDERITKFVLPLGSMVNMDGTALYEAVASIFIAQMNGLEMGVGHVITVSITATLASIGAASIPSAGLVTMMIVLTALDLPVDDISLIIAVDWLLDRLRTSVNVIGDAFGCGFVYHLCKKDLDALPMDEFENSEIDEILKQHGVNVDEFNAQQGRKQSQPETETNSQTATQQTDIV